jgi:hypothetical protein
MMHSQEASNKQLEMFFFQLARIVVQGHTHYGIP